MPHVCVTVFPSCTTQATDATSCPPSFRPETLALLSHHLTSSARSSKPCCLKRLDSSCHSDGRSRMRSAVGTLLPCGVSEFLSTYQLRWSVMIKYSIRVRTTGSYLRSPISESPNMWQGAGPTGPAGSRYCRCRTVAVFPPTPPCLI